jgi:hypothetical protein
MKTRTPITSIDQLSVGTIINNSVEGYEDSLKVVSGICGNAVILSFPDGGYCATKNLYDLTVGNYVIMSEEVRWKPQRGDRYYFPAFGSGKRYGINWTGNKDDLYRLNAGLVFKTSEEAIDCTEKLLKVLKDNQ